MLSCGGWFGAFLLELIFSKDVISDLFLFPLFQLIWYQCAAPQNHFLVSLPSSMLPHFPMHKHHNTHSCVGTSGLFHLCITLFIISSIGEAPVCFNASGCGDAHITSA